MKGLFRIFGVVLLVAGAGLFLYPDISAWIREYQTAKYIEEFNHRSETDDLKVQHHGEEEAMSLQKESDKRYKEILDYNKYIYETGQADFKDICSYTQLPISVENLEDDAFGYLEIPAIDAVMPLYVGASDENMSKGAAILGQTSIPIGGMNTNSVIAGHRGWRGASYFLDIEQLTAGDRIYITNFWETLVYQVESTKIIEPYDSDAVRIQDGKDMITLITCHPYMSHGKYRYVVYCVRDEKGADGMAKGADLAVGNAVPDGTVYGSSQKMINGEKLLRRAGALFIVITAVLTALYERRIKMYENV